jgi:single stranded DNA-binding protein (ssb)
MESTSLNRIELRGRVGQDPRVMSVGDSQVARFSVATNETYKTRKGELVEETTWHNIAVWNGKNIDSFDKIKKGVLVQLSGRLRNSKYTAEDGTDRYFGEVVANRLQVVEPES